MLIVVMLLSCLFTFFLNYIVVLNTTINSALTQAICGNLKDVFTSGIGWMIFGGLPYDLISLSVLEDIISCCVSKGYVFQIEMIVRASRKGYHIEELGNFVTEMVGKDNLKTEDLNLCFENLMMVGGGGNL